MHVDPLAVAIDASDPSRPVDVSLDEVSAEPVADASDGESATAI